MTDPANGRMDREAEAVRAALKAAQPRYALRDTVRDALGDRLITPDALIRVLNGLADEYRAQGSDEQLADIVEILDLLEGQVSDAAMETYFEGVHPANGRMDIKRVIERYERLLDDRGWPASQEAARRAVKALVRALSSHSR